MTRDIRIAPLFTALRATPRCRRLPIALAALALVGGVARADRFTKVALLTGSQEVPANTSPARGCARFVVDTAAKTVTYHISYSGLLGAETGAHFHGPAGPGVNAGIVQPLPAGNPKTGVWAYPAGLEADILEGRIYVNIHTTMFPGGELRGQVVDMVALLDGAQEVPPSGSAAQGYGLFNVDPCLNELRYTIAYTGFSTAEVGAHIHGYALHGVSAGIRHPLPGGLLKTGVWHYADADEVPLLEGRAYVNIHSNAFPGGEIRGQIVNVVAPMDGGQEVPPNGSPGAGCGLVATDLAANTLSYHMSTLGLTGPLSAAHIHGFAPPGANAGIQHNVGTANPAIGTWVYGAANAANVLGGLTYFNGHTVAFPGGEVRGQILFPTARPLDCTFEALCFGVGCPCGNDDPTAGCANSTGSGGRLQATGGTPSVTADDLVLTASQLPTGNQGLFYMGDTVVMNPFFDGFQCALGTTQRFLTSIQGSGATGTMTFTGWVAASGGLITPGSTWYFHCWHRDVPGSPCGTGANLTHLLGVTFAP